MAEAMESQGGTRGSLEHAGARQGPVPKLTVGFAQGQLLNTCVYASVCQDEELEATGGVERTAAQLPRWPRAG